MRIGFEKRFKNGDIVYFHRQIENNHVIEFGMVDEQFSDTVCIDMLEVKENRLINGIPINDFPYRTELKKLPKGWTWNTKLYEITYASLPEYDDLKIDVTDPETIKHAYNIGALVKADTKFGGVIDTEITKDGYRIVKKYPEWQNLLNHRITHTSIRPDRVYFTYQEAKDEVDAIKAEIERQASLSDYEWSVEKIDKVLDRYKGLQDIPEETIQKYRDWLLDMKNVEDIEVRIGMCNLQWKYEKNKRWNNIEL